MKILKVKSLNINSLKGKFEIDFESFLKDESLFAITGPTGAGKSTILDIITCALYARTPRLSNPSELMSRNTAESFCEVEFEIKGRVYRSSWGINRARKKADGKFQSAKMEIVDLESNEVLESYLSKVPKVVEEISGLDFDRFVQSMMLAQGSFDAFLKAKENERSNLLEKITGTHIYKQISQEVYETYSAQNKAIGLDENSLGSIELLQKDALEEKTKLLDASKQQKKELDKKELELKKISIWLENLQKLEQDNIKYAQEFTQVTQEKEDKKEDFKKLKLANKALNVQVISQEKNSLAKTISEDKLKLQKLQGELKDIKLLLDSKTKELKLTKENLDKEKTYFEQNTLKIKELRVKNSQVKSKTEASKQIDTKVFKNTSELATYFDVDAGELLADEKKVQKYSQEHSQQIKTLADELQTLQNEYKVLEQKTLNSSQNENASREKLKNLDELLKSLQELEDVLKSMDLEHKASSELKKEIDSISLLNAEKIKLVAQIQQTLQTLKEKKETELLIKKYEDDRAKLKDKQECFLCGSKEHPYINHTLTFNIDETTQNILNQEAILAKESDELKQSEIKLATLNSQLETAHLELEKLNSKKTKIDEFFKTCDFNAQQTSKDDSQEQKDQVEKELKEMVHLREQKDKLSSKKEMLQQKYNDKQQRQASVKNILSSLQELKKDQDTLSQEIQELNRASKNILDVQNIDAYEVEIAKRYNEINDAYNALQNSITSLNSKDESLNIQTKELSQKQANENKKLDELTQEFAKALGENGFASKEEFENAVLAKELREELSKMCKTIEDRYSQTKTLKNETATKLKEHKELNLSQRELASVNEELQELQTKIDELQKNIGSVEKELEINAQNNKKHEDKIKGLESKKETFKVWVKLNEMIGSSQGDKFAKFAQGITLDQLIYLANKHLNILSPRYELKRGLDSNKLLEIEIVDGFQGDVVRGVNTLSGGESFIVSLSLALGLSSLASQKISIDSLFLDEGFGTLDSDSLELALNALNQLKDSGKMVGVISHVEALKERIPLQVKVLPKGDGTSVLDLN
jgi:exonuclease SbcC